LNPEPAGGPLASKTTAPPPFCAFLGLIKLGGGGGFAVETGPEEAPPLQPAITAVTDTSASIAVPVFMLIDEIVDGAVKIPNVV